MTDNNLKSLPEFHRQKTAEARKTAQGHDQYMRKAAVVSDQPRKKDDQGQKHDAGEKVKRPYGRQAGIGKAADNNTETEELEHGSTNSGVVNSEHDRHRPDSGLRVAFHVANVPHDFVGHDHGEHIDKCGKKEPVRLCMRAHHRKNQQAERPSRARTQIFDDEQVFKTQIWPGGYEGSIIKKTDSSAKGDQPREFP